MKYWQNREWLEVEYVINLRTTQDIAKQVEVNSGTVYYWIKKVGLRPRKNYNASKARLDLLQNKEWMVNQYVVNKTSLKHLAAITGVSALTARRYLVSHDISINCVGVVLSDAIYPSRKGSNSPTWKGGKSLCVDCRTQLAARYKGSGHRCMSCKSKFYRGNKHHSWQADKSPESCSNAVRRSADYKDWRKAVYERDGYTCTLCGIRGGSLHAHHLNCFSDFPEQRYDVQNGVTLCKEHHLAFHGDYGMGGNTAEQFHKFTASCKIETTEMTY